MSEALTEGIRITVRCRYLENESEPDRDQYLFAYEVQIDNEGLTPAQLLTRHWIIQDANNYIEEVIGEGVVGQTPFLKPGESFKYTSFCPLRTTWGTMRGTYGMQRPDGAHFDAVIAPFALMPHYLLN